MNRASCVSCAASFVMWQANSNKLRGCTRHANLMNINEYMDKATVIFPLIIEGSFCVSAIAAKGIPQLATGPQKWVLIKYCLNSLLFSCCTSFPIMLILNYF